MQRIQKLRKTKAVRFLKRYVNGTKGVISIFLAILMVPFVSIAGMLINAGRINSAVAIFDEALCNASNSTLGTYDEFLRSRFALMAISQDTSNNNVPATGSYSADTFIDDLFNYYMEKNVGSLSATYATTDVNATGLYQLANTDVLKASVLQAGKITVPAKLMSDWGSFDDLIDKLTKPFNWVSNVEKFVSSASGTAEDVKLFVDAKDAAETAITASKTAKTNYDNAYNSFMSAVNAYNSLIDKIINQQNTVDYCEKTYEALCEKNKPVTDKIAELEKAIEKLNEELEELSPGSLDYIQKEQEIEIANRMLEKEKLNLDPELATAKKNLEIAEANLQYSINQQPSKRNSAESAKQAYYTKIIELISAMETTKDKVLDFQDKTAKLLDGAVKTIEDTVSMSLNLAIEGNKNQQDDLEKQQKQNGEDNRDRIDELVEKERELKNWDTGTDKAKEAHEKSTKKLKEFATEELGETYTGIIDGLKQCAENVNGLAIPPAGSRTYIKFDANKTYYCEFDYPVHAGTITALVEAYEKQLNGSPGVAVLKALVGFIKALIEVDFISSSSLNASINTSLYTDIGGLPSLTMHQLNTQYDKQDAAQSQIYKELLNSYSSETVYDMSVEVTVFDQLLQHFDTLLNTDITFGNFGVLTKAVGGIIVCLGKLALSKIGDMLLGMRDKIYIAGYISYNTANRTTYDSGKALSGQSYELPVSGTTDGYTFCGAETEYIISGHLTKDGDTEAETANQRQTFLLVMCIRMIFDLYCVLSDPTVVSVMSALASISFGVLGVVAGVLWVVAEAFVDSIMLVNDGSIPLVKTTAYLSPQGIVPLIEEVMLLKLSDANKEKVYNSAKKCGNKIAPDVEYDSFQDYNKKAEAKDNKITSVFDMDYTKALQFVLLFWPTKLLLQRLSDVIQMEATYYYTVEKEKDFKFNLDKSYTYLRAAGTFRSNVFIKIGDEESLTSTNRVIYNGY